MTITFTLTREQLAAQVLGKLQAIEAGETAAAADLTLVYQAFDMRLKGLHAMGIYWRKVGAVPLSFSVSSGVNSASATADIQVPIVLTFTNGTSDQKVDIIGPAEYAAIQDKAYSGNPQKAVWNRAANFTFWPVPSGDGTCKLLYEKIADDTAASTTPDVDVSMLRWLRDMIAYDLGDHYGKTEGTMARFYKESVIAERNIRKLVVPITDYTPVAVDDFRGRQGVETDYGWYR